MLAEAGSTLRLGDGSSELAGFGLGCWATGELILASWEVIRAIYALLSTLCQLD